MRKDKVIKLYHMKKLFFLLLLTGCLTKEKALRKIEPDLAKICADKFPVKDSTIYIKGDTINTVEFFENSDTVNVVKYDTVYNTVTNTVTKVVKQRITDTLRLVRENTARVAALQADKEALQDRLNKSIAYGEKWHNRAGDYLFWLIALVVLNLLFVAFKLFKK